MVFNNFISSISSSIPNVSSIFSNWRKRKRGNDEDDKDSSKKKKINNYTITPVAKEKEQKKRYCYYVGEELSETESRQIEYKAGGCLFPRETLTQLIQKYACAFLNSEGGVLLCGVTDRGMVSGVYVSYDDWKAMTQTIKLELERFRPTVPSSLYSVKQYPVLSKPGAASSTLCIVQLTFQKGVEGQLYENGNHCVYLRRDGGVQGPLRPLEIKDLVISKYNLLLKERKEQEMNKIEKEVTQRKRLKSKNIEYITID